MIFHVLIMVHHKDLHQTALAFVYLNSQALTVAKFPANVKTKENPQEPPETASAPAHQNIQANNVKTL